MSYIGSTKIGKMFLGDTEIAKAYLGDDLVFQKGGSPTPVLPTGYTALTYVETPKNTEAYINTGITASNNTGFYIDALTYDATATTGYGCLFGSRAGSNSSDFQLSTYTASGNNWGGTVRRGTASQNYNAHLPVGTRFEAKLNGNKYSISGSDYTTAASISSGKEIYLFALNNNGTAAQYGHLRVYRFKLFNGTTLVLDYIPCRNASNVTGFYDLVSQSFVSPASGQLFGVDESATTYDSTVSYLEGAGASYIDTGIGVITGSTKVEIECQFTDNYSSTQIIVGAGTSSGQWIGNVSSKFGLGSGAAQMLSSSDQKKTLTLTYTSALRTDATDGTLTAYTTASVTFNKTIKVFSAGTSSYLSYAKVWSVKIYNGSTLLRNLVPVVKNNVGYFYDTVSGLLFGNLGSSPFIVGQ